MRVAILGGGNCHALALVRHLDSLGVDCFGIGRAPRKAPPLWLAPHNYRYRQAHLVRDLQTAMEILDRERPTHIVCFAAQGESAASFGGDAWRFFDTNCVALAKVVEQLRQRDYLRRFIQVSTSELYGSVTAPAGEDAPIRPSSPYAASKAAFDIHLEAMHRVHGFPAVIVRPSNAYCEGQQLHRIVPRAVIAAVYLESRLALQGGGRAQKSYLHSGDVATAIALLLTAGRDGEIYNVGPEEPVAIREIVEVVAEHAGVAMASFVDEVPARLGEDGTYWLDATRIRAAGWRPTVDLEDGIDRVISWAKRFPELATMPADFEMRP